MPSIDASKVEAVGLVADKVLGDRVQQASVEAGSRGAGVAQQGDGGPERLERLENALEAGRPWFATVLCCGLSHHGADQVVGERVGLDLLTDRLGRLATQALYPHLGLDAPQVQLVVSPPPVEISKGVLGLPNWVERVARAIKQRLVNVVSCCTHGITNAVAEGINSKIMAIKQRIGGYRNRENF